MVITLLAETEADANCVNDGDIVRNIRESKYIDIRSELGLTRCPQYVQALFYNLLKTLKVTPYPITRAGKTIVSHCDTLHTHISLKNDLCNSGAYMIAASPNYSP